MKKFILKVLLFFALVVVMDYTWGGVFSWLRSHAKGGSTANCEYIANLSEDDIIILGSSRATHHYVPKIIEDSLGLSCYNCGEEGNGVVLAYGRFKQITHRYRPKLVVYEVTPGYDYLYHGSDTKYLGYLRPYYNQREIKPIIDDFGGEFISIKMISKMYQNNDKLLSNVIDNILIRDNNRGFSPLFGKKETGPDRDSDIKHDSYDDHKLNYLEKLVVECRELNVPICFVVSPKCETGINMVQYQPAIEICKKYNIPFINYLYVANISEVPSLFQDVSHLNQDGAEQYTSLFVTTIKQIFNL